MTEHANLDQRMFVRRGAMGAGALWMLSLGATSWAGMRRVRSRVPTVRSAPSRTETTGLHLLQLPDGFRYASYS
jgi:hypothetical protein